MSAAVESRILFVLVAAIVAVAITLARKGDRRGAVAFVLAWVAPGAGHVVAGKWAKGIVFFLLLSGTFVFGLWLVEFRSVSFDDNPFYYVGQYGSGTTLAVAKLWATEKAFPRPDLEPSWFDPGLLYGCVAGLLNLVVMMNVLEVRMPSKPVEAPPEKAAPAPSEKPA